MRYREILEYRVSDPHHGKEDGVVAEVVRLLVYEASHGGEDEAKYAWRIDRGVEPYGANEEHPEAGQEWEDHLQNWANDRVYEKLAEIEQKFTGDTIRIWRCITAPYDWKPDAQHPGIYWSWEESAAEAHWGNPQGDVVEWMMVAEAHHNQIDWVATLLQNSMSCYEDEKEIRLKPDTPVHLLKVWDK